MVHKFYDTDSIKMKLYSFELGEVVNEKEVMEIISNKERNLLKDRFIIGAYFEYNVSNPEDSDYNYALVNFSFVTFLEDRENPKDNDEFDEDEMIFRSQTQYKVEFTEPVSHEDIDEVTSREFRLQMVKNTISKFKLVFNMSLSQTNYEELSLTDNVVESMISRQANIDKEVR
ncbi:hypothetical protein [Exiguobacterium sp. s191]|uniref:hypothetical protein n=1 Tax=Exiguobacterium sp. s191 TaxID=2751196 RepID=UPI001BE5A779|nr:hypothetical protein [Exiguobacterium sp. s191]